MKFEGMYRELYYIISLPTRSERMTLFYEWFLKEKEMKKNE